ncbi:MAG: DNA polymerase I [Lysinibacillus sp.]
MISRFILNSLLAFAMASSVSAWFTMANFSVMSVVLFGVPVVWIALFIISFIVAQDVRDAFKKVLWYNKRADKRPIYQVGVGMILFFAQIGFVETFMTSWQSADLGGMPLYIVFSFMNAFLATVIFEEIFYVEEKPESEQFKFKKLK